MTPAVFDASALVPLYVEMATSAPAARCVAQLGVLSLDYTPIETANALARHVRAGRIGQDDALVAGRNLIEMARWLPSQPLLEDALKLSLSKEHSVYDCLYVACAQERDIPLVTADKKLVRKFADALPSIINLYDMPKYLQ